GAAARVDEEEHERPRRRQQVVKPDDRTAELRQDEARSFRSHRHAMHGPVLEVAQGASVPAQQLDPEPRLSCCGDRGGRDERGAPAQGDGLRSCNGDRERREHGVASKRVRSDRRGSRSAEAVAVGPPSVRQGVRDGGAEDDEQQRRAGGGRTRRRVDDERDRETELRERQEGGDERCEHLGRTEVARRARGTVSVADLGDTCSGEARRERDAGEDDAGGDGHHTETSTKTTPSSRSVILPLSARRKFETIRPDACAKAPAPPSTTDATVPCRRPASADGASMPRPTLRQRSELPRPKLIVPTSSKAVSSTNVSRRSMSASPPSTAWNSPWTPRPSIRVRRPPLGAVARVVRTPGESGVEWPRNSI